MYDYPGMFNKDLRSEFDKHVNDRERLRAIERAIQHRKRRKAIRLLDEVRAQIEVLISRQSQGQFDDRQPDPVSPGKQVNATLYSLQSEIDEIRRQRRSIREGDEFWIRSGDGTQVKKYYTDPLSPHLADQEAERLDAERDGIACRALGSQVGDDISVEEADKEWIVTRIVKWLRPDDLKVTLEEAVSSMGPN